MGLSAARARAVDEAARVVRELVEQECERNVRLWRRTTTPNGGRRMIGTDAGHGGRRSGVAYVVVNSLPDVARYLKIRQM